MGVGEKESYEVILLDLGGGGKGDTCRHYPKPTTEPRRFVLKDVQRDRG